MRASGQEMSVLSTVAVAAVVAGCGMDTVASKSTASPAQLPATDPYRAAVAYADCMRRHGVPYPSPDRVGDFHLTAAGEMLLRRVPRSPRQAADNACFRHLKHTVRTKPLSQHAKARAIKLLQALGRCLQRYGYSMGPPVVRDLPRGRAFFGFSHPPTTPAGRARANERNRQICEKRVDLAGTLDQIIAEDRGVPNLGGL
jgi:hypothetical protein